MKRRDFGLRMAAAAIPGAAAGALASLAAAPALAQAAGSYLTLTTPAPVDAPKGSVEVIEFFSYGCPHCRDFDPIFDKWKKTPPKGAVVRREHVGFNKSFEPLQRIFYTLEALGQTEKVHTKVFEAILNKHTRLDQPDVLFAWVAEQGIDRSKFEQAYKSFGVSSRIRRAIELQEAYKVEATPSLGIAGRYYTDPSKARGFEGMLQTANQLIEKELTAG